jgi:hypothetical protein
MMADKVSNLVPLLLEQLDDVVNGQDSVGGHHKLRLRVPLVIPERKKRNKKGFDPTALSPSRFRITVDPSSGVKNLEFSFK